MIILTTGSREWDDDVAPGIDLAIKAKLISPEETIRVVHGHNPRGADHLVDQLIQKRARLWSTSVYELKRYPADWDKHGKAGGILRNIEMLKSEQPDICVAYLRTDLPCKGTRDMMERCFKAGVPVLVVTR